MIEVLRFSEENLLSHSTEKLRRGTLLCFTKFPVAGTFNDKRGGGGGGKEYQAFQLKSFCLTLSKVFLGNPSDSENFRVSRNFMPKKGISRIVFIEILLFNSSEKRRSGTLLSFTKLVASKKFMVKRREGGRRVVRGYHGFLSKVFCLTVPKFFVGEPFRVSLFSGIEKFHDDEGNITIYYGKIVASQYRSFS